MEHLLFSWASRTSPWKQVLVSQWGTLGESHPHEDRIPYGMVGCNPKTPSIVLCRRYAPIRKDVHHRTKLPPSRVRHIRYGVS